MDNEEYLIQKMKRMKRFVRKMPEHIRGLTMGTGKETLNNTMGNIISGVIPATMAGVVGNSALFAM